MTAKFRVRDAMGRERWVEQPIDEIVTRRDSCGARFEGEDEELRRTRDAGLSLDLKALWFEVLRAREGR